MFTAGKKSNKPAPVRRAQERAQLQRELGFCFDELRRRAVAHDLQTHGTEADGTAIMISNQDLIHGIEQACMSWMFVNVLSLSKQQLCASVQAQTRKDVNDFSERKIVVKALADISNTLVLEGCGAAWLQKAVGDMFQDVRNFLPDSSTLSHSEFTGLMQHAESKALAVNDADAVMLLYALCNKTAREKRIWDTREARGKLDTSLANRPVVVFCEGERAPIVLLPTTVAPLDGSTSDGGDASSSSSSSSSSFANKGQLIAGTLIVLVRTPVEGVAGKVHVFEGTWQASRECAKSRLFVQPQWHLTVGLGEEQGRKSRVFGWAGAAPVVPLHRCFGEEAQMTPWHRRVVSTELVRGVYSDIVLFSSVEKMLGDDTTVASLRIPPNDEDGYRGVWAGAAAQKVPFDGMLGPYYFRDTRVGGLQADPVAWVRAMVPLPSMLLDYTRSLSDQLFTVPVHLPDLFDKATGLDLVVDCLDKRIRGIPDAENTRGAVMLSLWQNGGCSVTRAQLAEERSRETLDDHIQLSEQFEAMMQRQAVYDTEHPLPSSKKVSIRKRLDAIRQRSSYWASQPDHEKLIGGQSLHKGALMAIDVIVDRYNKLAEGLSGFSVDSLHRMEKEKEQETAATSVIKSITLVTDADSEEENTEPRYVVEFEGDEAQVERDVLAFDAWLAPDETGAHPPSVLSPFSVDTIRGEAGFNVFVAVRAIDSLGEPAIGFITADNKEKQYVQLRHLPEDGISWLSCGAWNSSSALTECFAALHRRYALELPVDLSGADKDVNPNVRDACDYTILAVHVNAVVTTSFMNMVQEAVKNVSRVEMEEDDDEEKEEEEEEIQKTTAKLVKQLQTAVLNQRSETANKILSTLLGGCASPDFANLCSLATLGCIFQELGAVLPTAGIDLFRMSAVDYALADTIAAVFPDIKRIDFWFGEWGLDGATGIRGSQVVEFVRPDADDAPDAQTTLVMVRWADWSGVFRYDVGIKHPPA